MSSPDTRLRMAAAIVDFEARRDKFYHLTVYHPPANDGGGAYEVAGLNQRYDKEAVDHLIVLINAKRYDEAEAYARETIASQTDVAASWHDDGGVEFYLRDCVFNRGAKGAMRILQRAMGVPDDGVIGPVTRGALAKRDPEDILTRLRWAREDYERNVVGYRANVWNGLVNRWDKALVTAHTFIGESAAAPEAPVAPPKEHWFVALLRAIFAALFGKADSQAPAPAAPTGEPQWLTLARADIGFHETGENRGIEKFITLAKCGSLGDPWCAIFTNAKLEQSGVPGTRSAMARAYEKHKSYVELAGPALGAVSTYWRGSKSSGSGHVNFYAGTDAQGRNIGIGGNQRDAVSAAYMDMSRHTGWWWPASVPLPAVGAVRVSGLDAINSGKET